MLRGGISLKDYLKVMVIREVQRHKEIVINRIKQDAYERVLTLVTKIRDRFKTGDQKGYIGKTRTSAKEFQEKNVVRSFMNRRNELYKPSESYKVFDEIMFIGGYVNHLAQTSIAAVVGSLECPSSKPYAAMVRAQTHRQETIQSFGEACLHLIEARVEMTEKRPNKIVIFRYAITTEVLLDELNDLEQSLHDGDYKPAIIVIVAKKRTSYQVLEERDDNLDFYTYRGVEFDFKIFHGHGIFSISNLLSYLCYKEATAETSSPLICTFKMVPPIIYAHLAAVRVHEGDPISDELWSDAPVPA